MVNIQWSVTGAYSGKWGRGSLVNISLLKWNSILPSYENLYSYWTKRRGREQVWWMKFFRGCGAKIVHFNGYGTKRWGFAMKMSRWVKPSASGDGNPSYSTYAFGVCAQLSESSHVLNVIRKLWYVIEVSCFSWQTTITFQGQFSLRHMFVVHNDNEQ